MRTLAVNTSEDPVASDILFALQLRTANEPLLPRLKTFECKNVTEAFIPFIPLFLSRKTVWVEVEFAKGSPTVMAASMIARLSALCPDLERIVLNDLTRSPVITEAVSEMVLTCNRSALRWFHVDSPLTEEAQRVVYQLPKLSGLWTVIQGHTLIPTVALPNLTSIDLEYDDHLDWLQGFRGSAFERLKTVYFRSESDQIGDFLGEFESVALTSISATLSTFEFHTSRSWNPNYRSLLPFTQLKVLTIEFSCGDKCSSRVTDNTIVDLVQAMPKLKILKLGNAPCGASTGVTIKGLITLARGCRYLSDLRIHFRTASFVQTIAALESQPLSNDKTSPRRQDCALTNLEVGRTPLPKGFKLAVTLTLLQIFPRLLNIGFGNKRWRKVEEDIKLFKRIGTFVHHTGETHLLYLQS